MELFKDNFRWDSLEAQFYQWLKPIPDRYCELLNPKERVVHETLLSEYPQLNKNELAFIMGWIHNKYQYMNIGIENQNNIADDILESQKMLKDNVQNITLNGGKSHKFKDRNLIKQMQELIEKRLKFFEKQMHTEYLIKDGQKTPKNYFIKKSTTDLYNSLKKRYNLGNSQAKCVIGEIYSCYGIGLELPILTREQFNKEPIRDYPNYKSYLIAILKSYLIN